MRTALVFPVLHLDTALGPIRRHRRLAGSLVLLLLTGLVFYFADRWRAGQPAPVHYRSVPAHRGSLTVNVTATGQLQPTRIVDVGSEVSGIIDSVEVNYNDPVRAGQILARINTEKINAQIQQDTANLATARARVEDAIVTANETEKAFKRMSTARELSHGVLPSQADLDTAQAAWERAKVAVTSTKAAVGQAEATLALSQTNLARAVIKSPVNGIVLARNAEPGQTIASSFNVATMFQIAEDLARMKLYVNIDEADVGQVREGQPVTFTVDAFPGRPFPGRIVQLRYQATTTNNVVTYLAVIAVDNRELLLRPGMTATATITVLSVDDALLVPNRALRFTPDLAQPVADERSLISRLTPGRPPRRTPTATSAKPETAQVWILDQGQPRAVPVKTGATDGRSTQILSGSLQPGVPVLIETLRTTP